jgi:hypothetical protein
MSNDFAGNMRRMLDDQDAEVSDSDSNRERFYHGVSSTQRGGSALDKVMDIIDLGYLFPGGKKDFTALDLVKMAVVAHADARGVRDSNPVSVDEYIERCGDAELLEKHDVKEYLTDDNMRRVANRFRYNRVVPGSANRDYTNFFSGDEIDTQETYGDEAYFEFSIPKENVYKSFDGAVDARTHKPLSLENARRLVIGNRHNAKVSELRKKLSDKGFNHVSVEVGTDGS